MAHSLFDLKAEFTQGRPKYDQSEAHFEQISHTLQAFALTRLLLCLMSMALSKKLLHSSWHNDQYSSFSTTTEL